MNKNPKLSVEITGNSANFTTIGSLGEMSWMLQLLKEKVIKAYIDNSGMTRRQVEMMFECTSGIEKMGDEEFQSYCMETVLRVLDLEKR